MSWLSRRLSFVPRFLEAMGLWDPTGRGGLGPYVGVEVSGLKVAFPPDDCSAEQAQDFAQLIAAAQGGARLPDGYGHKLVAAYCEKWLQ